MVITYQGENYVKIQAGTFTLLVDPTDERSFRGATLTLHTRHPAPLAERKDGADLMTLRNPLWIDRPGEYEVEGVRIAGIAAGRDGERSLTAYRITMDDITLAFLGHVKESPDQKTLSALADADILFLPGGGKPWLKEADAAKLVRQLEPGIVVPMLITKNGCDSFCKELGAATVPPAEKLVIKKKDITSKAMAVACLAA